MDKDNKRKKHLERCQRYFLLLHPSQIQNKTSFFGSHIQLLGSPLCTTLCWRSSLSPSTGSLDSSMLTLFSRSSIITMIGKDDRFYYIVHFFRVHIHINTHHKSIPICLLLALLAIAFSNWLVLLSINCCNFSLCNCWSPSSYNKCVCLALLSS